METVDQSAVFASFNDFRGDAVVSWRFVCRERINCFVQLLDVVLTMNDNRCLEIQTYFHFEIAKIFLHKIEVKGLVKLMVQSYRFKLLASGW